MAMEGNRRNPSGRDVYIHLPDFLLVILPVTPRPPLFQDDVSYQGEEAKETERVPVFHT